MNNKQLALLFGSMLFNFTLALGVLPFLPLHAITNLGADPSRTGLFLSVISIALTAGTIGGGWLSDRFKRRKLLIRIGSLMGFPSFFLIGYATNIWQLTFLAAVAWFAIGMATTMVRIMTGLLADESERGRIFGVIGAATPLAALVGGGVSGPIVDRWNIPILFMVMSAAFVLQFIIVFFITDIPAEDDSEKRKSDAEAAGFGLSYWLLAGANFIIFMSLSTMITGRPLRMDQLGFDGTAISQVLVPGAFVSLPLTFYIGMLSDRLGRKNMMILCYVVATMGMGLLIVATPLWHFWLSEICLAFVGISTVVAAALVTDIVPRNALDKAMSQLLALGWVGTIIGFAISGYIIDWVGLGSMFGVATALVVVALVIILPIQQSREKVKVGGVLP